MIEVLGVTLSTLHLVVLLVVAIAVVTDLTTMRIPNGLTYPLWGIGVIWHGVAFFLGTGDAWWTGLLGLVVLFPVHFALFAVGIDKGGDAKLMIGVGACLGWWVGIEATVWSILLMGPVAVLIATLMGKLPSVWKTFVYLIKAPYYRTMKLDPGPKPEQTYVPKAPVIAISVLVALFTPWLDTVFFGAEG